MTMDLLPINLQTLKGVIGPNEQPSNGSQTVVLNFWPDRITGVIYTEADDADSFTSKSSL